MISTPTATSAAERRPSKPEYFMLLALTARSRADCQGRKVGAIIVRDDRVISTGYNGTPIGMPNCSEGGCVRCADHHTFQAGSAYDLCICVHGEQNAVLAAARFGQSVLGATLYSTMRPCFGCLKELLQAGVGHVVFLQDWQPAPGPHADLLATQYRTLSRRFNTFANLDPDRLKSHLSKMLYSADV